MDGLSALSGQFAGRYVIERSIGHGATAMVYLARDTDADRFVAIKALKPELAESLGSARFLREIKVTEGLHHPRILPVLDSGEFAGVLYFVLPYMDGGTLRDRLDREPQLPIAEAVGTACTIADALAYAHGQGFVHRDVKPENILFSKGEAYLADFGIARAIERSIEDPTTSTGIARGTAAYMSPEQASAAREYDGRTDIYSLACVLYEMIAGMRAFIAPTTQAVIAQRFQHAPRELSVYRPNVPPKLEAVIRRALQLLPADRYRTAAEFSQALCAVPIKDFEERPDRISWLGEIVRTPARRIALGAVLLVVVGGLAFGGKQLWSSNATEVAIDTTRVVLLPLAGSTSTVSSWRHDDLMHQALSRWRGLHVVDQFQVADAMRRVNRIESTGDAVALVSSLGAGRYIRGQLTPQGDESRAYVGLFDVRNRTLYSVSATVPNDLAGATSAYARLADSLLLRGAQVDSAPPNQIGSRSLPAVQAFGRGLAALDMWNLAGADSAFQAATAFDPEYARAIVWLAQVGAWRGQAQTTWKLLAERALALSDQLTERERQLATALLSLGRGEYAHACDIYARMTARNDRDFSAWFGLGQCRRMDRIVVADPRSPSGWRFRSSAARAMEAYAKAFEILPSVHRGYERGAFEGLRRLLLVSQTIMTGYRQSDSAMFYGRPALIGDSLVIVAYPWQVVFSGDRSSIPPGFHEALAQRRAAFRKIAAGWSAAFPRNAGAKHAVAISLEQLGDPSSIDTLRLARRLEVDSTRRRRFAAAEVILLTKFGLPDDLGRLSAARSLADSLLASGSAGSVGEAQVLAPVAALTGRCGRIDEIVRQAVPAGGSPGMPAPLLRDANVLVTRIAMGCSVRATSLSSVSAAVEQSVSRVGSDQHQRLEQMLLYRPVVLAPFLDRDVTDHIAASSKDALLEAAHAVVHGENKRARAALTAVENRVDPGVPTPDITLARATLWMHLGDSSRASRTLDTALEAVRLYELDDLSDAVNAGALVRAMILRADLAKAKAEHTTARRWASAASALWSSAGPDLKSRIGAASQYAATR